VVFEVIVAESLAHGRRKAEAWFASFDDVAHVVLIWTRTTPYQRTTNGIPPGQYPLWVFHYVRDNANANGCSLTATLAPNPIEVGSNWQNSIPPPARGQRVLQILSDDLFSNNNVVVLPPGFPVQVDIDLFVIHQSVAANCW